jgi:glycerophosphoryl diester phosphodiesterase
MRLIGHKGADAIRPGNTIESFEAAVEAGAWEIELDVLRPRSDFAAAGDWRTAAAGPVADPAEPLVIAHDWTDAARRRPLTLAEGLEVFSEAPLDVVRLDLDLKIAGREDEVVAALREHELLERAGVSTMEVASLAEIHRLEPQLRLGWTVPRITRNWNDVLWAKPLLLAGLISLRRSLPRLVPRRAPALGVSAVWAYHAVITAGLVRACREAGLELIAWTVDELARMRQLCELGVDGICSNDPRLFAEL